VDNSPPIISKYFERSFKILGNGLFGTTFDYLAFFLLLLSQPITIQGEKIRWLFCHRRFKVKNYVWILAVFLAILMAGCGSDTPTVSENDIGQAQLAPASTETQINSLILAEAARQNGWKFNNVEGQCKKWVQNVVYKSTSKSLPENDHCVLYQWKPSSVVKITWQVKFACVGSFSSNIKPGQIMQIQWLPTYMKGGQHTLIIKAVSSSSLSYWECNGMAGAYTVGSYTESTKDWSRHAAAWTVYQVVP
jgi:hypothetical protein